MNFKDFNRCQIYAYFILGLSKDMNSSYQRQLKSLPVEEI